MKKKLNLIYGILVTLLLINCKTDKTANSDTARAFREFGKISYDIGFYAVDYEKQNGLLLNSTAKGELDYSGDQFIGRNNAGFSSQTWENNGIDGLYLKMVVLPNNRNGDPLKQMPELVKMKSGRILSIEKCFCEDYDMTLMRINVQNGDSEIVGAEVCVGANQDPKRPGILLAARVSMAKSEVSSTNSNSNYFTHIDADITFQSKGSNRVTQNLYIKNIKPNDVSTKGWPKSVSLFESDSTYPEKPSFIFDELASAVERIESNRKASNVVCPKLDFATAGSPQGSFESEILPFIPLPENINTNTANNTSGTNNINTSENYPSAEGSLNASVSEKTSYYFDAIEIYNRVYKGKGYNAADVFNKLDETNYTDRAYILNNQHHFNLMVKESQSNNSTTITDSLESLNNCNPRIGFWEKLTLKQRDLCVRVYNSRVQARKGAMLPAIFTMERFRLEQYVLSTDRDKIFQGNMIFEQNGSMESACEGVFGMRVGNFPKNAKYIKITGGRKACPLALWEIENRDEIITNSYSFGIEDGIHVVAVNDRLEVISSAYFQPNCSNHVRCQYESMYECDATGISQITGQKEKYVGDYIGSLPIGDAMVEAEKNALSICQENASSCSIVSGSCAYKGKMRGYCDSQGNRKMYENRKQCSPTVGLKNAFKRICRIIDIDFDE